MQFIFSNHPGEEVDHHVNIPQKTCKYLENEQYAAKGVTEEIKEEILNLLETNEGINQHIKVCGTQLKQCQEESS